MTSKRFRRWCTIVSGALLAVSDLASAQSNATLTARGQPPESRQGADPQLAPAPDAIVIEGIRVPGEEADGIDTADLSGGDQTNTTIAIRQKFEFSQRVADCAARGRLSSMQELRAAVDGFPNYSKQRYAQDLLVRKNVTCSESATLLSADPGFFGDSLYYRGAYVIAALRRFAANLVLTRAQTGDIIIQKRFNVRETPRNRFRLPADYHYFEIAVCMVRLQPTLSVKLTLESLDQRRTTLVERAIVAGARICVGNARQVGFDPTQFRMYIADAVYRWGVATRGIDSFIPEA